MEELIDSVKEYLNTHKSMSDASRATMLMEADRAAGLRARLFDVMEEAKKNYEANAVEEAQPEEETKNSLLINGKNNTSKYKNKKNYDYGIVNFVNGVLSGQSNKKFYKINKSIPQHLVNDIKSLFGLDMTGYGNELSTGGIEHIKDHMKNPQNTQSDTSMSNIDDWGEIADAIASYDKYWKGNGSREYHSDTIVLQKNMGDGYYYVVEAVVPVKKEKKKNLHVVSAFISKKDTSPAMAVSVDPSRYVQDGSQSEVSSSDSSIAPDTEKSTTSFSLKTPVEESGDLIAVHNINKQEQDFAIIYTKHVINN